MSDEEYISDEEFLANLQKIDNEKLMQSLQNCGHDGYYNDLYYPIIGEIKRRLSSTSAVSERIAKVVHSTTFGEWKNMCGHCFAKGRKMGLFPRQNYCYECGCKLDWSDDE